MHVRRVLSSFALVLLMAAVAAAQTMPTGTVTGKVVDPEGLVLPGVTVTVTSANGDFIIALPKSGPRR